MVVLRSQIKFRLQAGFTLIEMSIVLVIIGLIIGGVLVGQDMILTAQIRKQITQIDKYTTAVNAFRDKYQCLPGNCANAVQLGLGQAGGPGANGVGDGVIANNTNGWNSFGTGTCLGDGWHCARDYESLNFWYHLGQAGLIENSYAGYTGQTTINSFSVAQTMFPSGVFPNTVLVPTVFLGTPYAQYRTAGNGFWLFAVGGAPYYMAPAVTCAVAQRIDAKIDDGLPVTGNVGLVENPANEYPLLSGPNPSMIESITCEWGGRAAGGPFPAAWNMYDVNGTNGYDTLNVPDAMLGFVNRF
jgi:prepilin-type N-terminal cleavage/methylation domain-containing protein